ncbi:MAG: two-component system sensor histidine kinase PilS (NtrC family) [Pseudohongiellaceae bacterium]|jgi:two-component system sensor histidine kinase PilS (NtrC family)
MPAKVAIITETMNERTAQYPGQIHNVSVVYNIYRIVLPLVLLVSSLGPSSTLLGALDPTLFIQACTAYAIFGVAISFFIPIGTRIFKNSHFLTGSLIIDIVTITLLTYSSGGMISGLGLLLIVTVASGSILIRGRISTFLAAVAALSLIYSELYLALSVDSSANQFVQTGILGAILFATSLYIQTLTNRIYKAAVLADKQASDIIDLEKLNNVIIQRMRTGVVVVNTEHQIVSMNSAARSILLPILVADKEEEQHPYKLPSALCEQLELWKINSKRQPQPIAIPNSRRQVQLNFAFLNPESDSDVLVFLEDNRQIVQRVRQMKFASLGRLTASIAHEVRNPLGAISHASQLLSESVTVTDHDKRMIEIILEHCNRVNLIIEDVLDASRHDDTTADLIDLDSWLSDFIENYKSTHELCDEIKLQIISPNAKIKVIKGQLEQVLNNLFDNGLRYSHKKTGSATLLVQAGIESKDGDELPFLHIIDEGPGINEDEESRLFEPFHTTESSGTGLGLYISKELCEANHSQLIYGRTPSGKSSFSIYFGNPDRVMT